MASENESLDFSYKYPFSKEALSIIGSAANSVEERFLKLGRLRLEEDLSRKEHQFAEVRINEIKRSIVISYVYSRMLASALNDRYLLNSYVNAESGRARSALMSEKPQNMLKLAEELGIKASESGGAFSIRFDQFLENKPKSPESSLVYKGLDKGSVTLSASDIALILGEAARKRISANLPINTRQLPKEVLEYAKGIKRPVRRTRVTSGRTYGWIEKILETPIPDVRHRTVNLVLAPYLVNVKSMAPEEAAKVIMDYIEKCKELNPDTKVNSSYVNYQCRYSKSKGTKPISLKRAKVELYSGILELGE